MRILPAVSVWVLTIAAAAAQTTRLPPPDPTPPGGKLLPLKGARNAGSCSAYGPGFVWVEASASCVKLGGSMDVGASGSHHR